MFLPFQSVESDGIPWKWFLKAGFDQVYTTRNQPQFVYSTATDSYRAEKVVIIRGQKSSIPNRVPSARASMIELFGVRQKIFQWICSNLLDMRNLI